MAEAISGETRTLNEGRLKAFRELIEQAENLPLSADDVIRDAGAEVDDHEPLPDMDVGYLASLLEERIDFLEGRVYLRDVGTVQQIGNGVATLSGLLWARSDELVTFATGVQGMVLNLDHDRVDVILLGSEQGISGGDLVTTTGRRLLVPVGPELLGRVVNPLGEPLDGLGPIQAAARHFLERDAPGIVRRTPVHEPMYTGLKVVDALLPLGRGQRELIAGDRKTGKTAIAVDAILRQRGTDVLCVYVSIGQKRSSALAVVETLRNSGALEHTIVVVASPDDPPALRYLAPYAACTMAEYLMYEHRRDLLIVYDDLSKHADSYREMSLLLRRPPGREAYPGDIFYIHARLLERAAKLNEEAGGGSLTALPIIELQRGNVSAYIPTNLISITDGQIILDTDLFNREIKPAVDVGRSVSRVGGTAQVRAMRDVAENLRLELSQFEEVARFARFGTEVEEETQRQIDRGQRLQAIFTQPVHQPLSLAQEVVILFAANEGYIDDIAPDRLDLYQRELLGHFHRELPALLQQIDREGELTDEIRNRLHEGISELSDYWAEGENSS
ncbi:MAG: F0F1 ATP synthase subunit alpha [Anaerolineae bacterium]|nr:F0F1 ATP synthase subunit alpha [Anaerolineae bacterium]